ncbi:Enamine deaminase RidA, house cleaning of reactive enamine intermediates, YjgF/YER057c/UK114 family [Actinacidiphila yanglinensis]|uniref:Enamine deaminase RidA, house cleaning of reactive enamine intermediates, YjgF/YER057c/UK114 family n=1 Tax=Actinacidiphila yanglinensis TaxID=310779 RepID=A0A1H5TMQ5_9ACTN|nr:Rid family hydrolase [Actinacidiphila yanglinensis]SEF64095.1 Enamine deaminase RidA, house cleaning of reactive enamine intermediates, YjgF/YER057c/UK114 family [Actinacidiphila yanglinensis]
MTDSTDSPQVHRIRSEDSSWEEAIGSSRAVAAGDRVIVAGIMPDPAAGSVPGDTEPYEQTLSAFRSALSALEPFDLDASAVIRTRMYLSHARDVDEVGRAHRELFAEVRPAATMVVVAGFADSRVLVEVEIEAYRGDARGVREDSGADRDEQAADRGRGAEAAEEEAEGGSGA